jgi:hypothetical protein
MTAGRQSVSKNKDWQTPSKYADAIHLFFENDLKLDPCANNDSLINAANKFILPLDGLSKEWNFKTIYINPPYGRDIERKHPLKIGLKNHLKQIIYITLK